MDYSYNGARQTSHYANAGAGRRHDANAEQIIRFVRDYQGLQRETTDLRMTKKAPLPGIGQSRKPPEQNPLHALDEDNDAAYVSDLDQDLDPLMPGGGPSHADVLQVNHNSPGRSQSYDGIQAPKKKRAVKHNPNGAYNRQSIPDRRVTADIRHLPPIELDDPWERPSAPIPDRPPSRQNRPKSARPGTRRSRRLELLREYSSMDNVDLPQRPSAPSPSITPPPADILPGHLAREEPIDYIDQA